MTIGRKAHVLTIDVDVRGALRGPAEVIEMPFRKSDSPESSSSRLKSSAFRPLSHWPRFEVFTHTQVPHKR